MATLICKDKDLKYTILPYPLDKRIEEELIIHPNDYVLGYITHHEDFNKRKFIYTDSGRLTEVNEHWSLDIIRGFPYCEDAGPWIVYNCSPEQTRFAFQTMCDNKTLTIYGWDTWTVPCKQSKVGVVTSWEIY